MDPLSIVIFLAILLVSVILHEVAHGIVADELGDPTARLAGRLTLNPIPHIDPFGSILLPAALLFFGSPFIFGAAKPVPVNYQNLRNFKRDMILVALAGPLTNFILAIMAGIVWRIFPNISEVGSNLLLQIIQLNLVLGVFNLIPIPPLDGSKILASIFGYVDRNIMYWVLELERFGFILIFLLLFSGFFEAVLVPAVQFGLHLITGQSIQLQ
jgi:Zn-dependent protease